MEQLLIFIKHHFRFLWELIEWSNSILFRLLYAHKLERIQSEVLGKAIPARFNSRLLKGTDMKLLHKMIADQDPEDLTYFHPHEFDLNSLNKQLKKTSFLMMGTFDDKRLVGYFFLRFFINRNCFVGRIIDKSYRGKDIGKDMNGIMYEIAWKMGFRCLSTISRNNTAVMHAHAKNPSMVILKELQNDYLLVEFINKDLM